MIGRWKQAGVFQAVLARWKLAATAVAAALLVESWLVKAAADDLGDLADLLALAAIVLAGGPVVAGAIAGLANRQANVDELVSLALVGCLAAGEFTSGAVVAVLMQLGTLAEEFTAARARAGIEHLVRLKPQRARVRRGEEEEEELEVNVTDLVPGDLVIVKAGEAIGADGEVTWGYSWIDESAITGESLASRKGVGSTVFAGTMNGEGALRVRVTRAGEDTTLARIVALVVDAEGRQAPIIRLADAFAGFFTPVILAVAAAVMWASGDLSRALAVLIVGCPCALILATPTAVVAALSGAARRGVLIKSGALLEEAARLDTVFFDKTGTLTTGRLEIEDLQTYEGFTRRDVLELAATAEKLARHPLAEVLLRAAGAEGIAPSDPDEFQVATGQGVTIRLDERRVAVGSREFVAARLDRPETFVLPVPDADDRAAVYVACDGRLAGSAHFRDQLRDDVRQAVTRLRELGVERVAILTGDRADAAEAMRRQAGVEEAYGELLPEQKLDIVRKAIDSGRKVAVVGDGVNDAPALAAAHVGIAMGASGTPVALETADVALMEDRIDRVALLVSLARGTRRVIAQNLWFAGLFNLGALVASGIGLLGPALAALLHNISSVAVVINSARLVRSGR